MACNQVDIKGNPDFEGAYVTDPHHGGKVDCHKCGSFIDESEDHLYLSFLLKERVYFHKRCYNPYEHYYGLDKPID